MAPASLIMLPFFQTLAREERVENSVSIALVGYGRRGEEIGDALAGIPGVNIAAIADIWSWRRVLAKNRLRALRHEVHIYETLDELLFSEGKAIDAVIICTPDWLHALHVSACLRADKHAYCDGEITHESAKARELVALAQKRRLLVQCGHQRRSNPLYNYAFDTIFHGLHLPEPVTHAHAQWHRGIAAFRAVPQRLALSAAELEKHGYANMEQFLNWEWFRLYGLGEVAARAGQKIDVLRWFWRAEPSSVTAISGNDYLHRETPDCLMAVFTFKLATGETRRGYVQILSTTSLGGEYEMFGGASTSLSTSENAPERSMIDVGPTWCWGWRFVPKEGEAMRMALAQGLLTYEKRPPFDPWHRDETRAPLKFPIIFDKTSLQSHLGNFISAIRQGTKLTDPIEQACKNLQAIECALRSAQEGRTIDCNISVAASERSRSH